MRSLLTSVVWRYVGLVVQFILVVSITRSTSPETAGHYFALFGINSVATFLVGFGITDGLVRRLPGLLNREQDELVRLTCIAVMRICVISSLAFAVIMSAVAIALGATVHVAILAGLWLFSYAMVFAVAQCCVAVDRPAVGSFIAYGSINIGYALVQLPAVWLIDNPSLTDLLVLAVVSATASLIAVGVLLGVQLRTWIGDTYSGRPQTSGCEYGTHRQRLPTFQLMVAGTPIMMTRLMQSCIPWIPVWVLIAFERPADAALFAAASRLSVAFSSVVAALRFASRSQVVRLLTEGEYLQVARLSQKSSMLGTITPIVGAIAALALGEHFFVIVFGRNYDGSSAVLIVLMAAVFAEGVGGIVDEILKMSRKTLVVVLSLAIALFLEILLAICLAGSRVHLVALSVVGAMWAQYAIQIGYVIWRSQIPLLDIRTGIKSWSN